MPTDHYAKKTLDELKRIQERVEAAIAKKQNASKMEFFGMVQSLAREKGFDIKDVVSVVAKTPKRGRRKISKAPRYKDPESGKTWTGHGRAPHWFSKDRAKELRIS